MITFVLSYFLLHETLPSSPFIYKGKTPRELIVVNQTESPVLDETYAKMKGELKDSFSEQDKLLSLTHFVGNLFPLEGRSEGAILTLRKKYGEEIPLDLFISEKIGVCRHTALVTTYFLNRLIEEGQLEGKAFLIRNDIPTGRHAWTLFLSNEGAWHIDALWGFIANGKTEKGWTFLCQKYGKLIMEKEKLRWTE